MNLTKLPHRLTPCSHGSWVLYWSAAESKRALTQLLSFHSPDPRLAVSYTCQLAMEGATDFLKFAAALG